MTLPYKYRGTVYLCLLCVVLPLVACRYALADSWLMWFDCRRLSEALEQLPPEQSRTEADAADEREMIFSGILLAAVERAATGAAVSGYTPSVAMREGDMAIHTAQIALCGEFAVLLRAVAQVERQMPGCRIRTLAWHLADDRAGRRLVLTLYVEQLVATKTDML